MQEWYRYHFSDLLKPIALRQQQILFLSYTSQLQKARSYGRKLLAALSVRELEHMHYRGGHVHVDQHGGTDGGLTNSNICIYFDTFVCCLHLLVLVTTLGGFSLTRALS